MAADEKRLIAAGVLLAGALMAQSGTAWTGGAEADLNGRYVWRGLTYSRGPAVQPWWWAKRNRTTVELWSSVALNPEPGRAPFDQIFFSATREMDWGPWKVEPTVQGYHWRGFGGEANATTLELSVRISRPLGPVRAFTSHTVDVASYRGGYVGDAGMVWKRTARAWEWEASGMAAWANPAFNRAYVGVARGAPNYAQAGGSATKRWNRGWYVRPHVEVVIVVSGAIRGAVDSRRILNGGVAIGREF